MRSPCFGDKERLVSSSNPAMIQCGTFPSTESNSTLVVWHRRRTRVRVALLSGLSLFFFPSPFSAPFCSCPPAGVCEAGGCHIMCEYRLVGLGMIA